MRVKGCSNCRCQNKCIRPINLFPIFPASHLHWIQYKHGSYQPQLLRKIQNNRSEFYHSSIRFLPCYRLYNIISHIYDSYLLSLFELVPMDLSFGSSLHASLKSIRASVIISNLRSDRPLNKWHWIRCGKFCGTGGVNISNPRAAS